MTSRVTKWRAHTIALGVWAIPPVVFGIIEESRSKSNFLDFGPMFTVMVVTLLWLVVAVPTTIAVAVIRSERAAAVVIVHAVAVFTAVMTYWFTQG